MEIGSVQNFYRMQSTQQLGRVKRSSEDARASVQGYETDTVDLSADAGFRATLAASARSYAAQSTQKASPEHIAALRQAYAGDKTPVSGKEIAASVLCTALGTSVE